MSFYYLLFWSIILLVGGFILLGSRMAFLLNSIEAEGVVVGEQPSAGSGGTRLFTPKVRFTDRDGKIHEVVTGTARSWGVREGRRVRVRYSPLKPEKARSISLIDYWFPPIGIIGFGLAVAVAFLDVAGWWKHPEAILWIMGGMFLIPLLDIAFFGRRKRA